MKKEKKDIVLIDDERFYVSIPLNYGACYVFNNEIGVPASFCTGSSTTSWFYRYAMDGPMIDVLDKNNINDNLGKWQLHAPTNQIKTADQGRDSRDEIFAKLFPGLLQRICNVMLEKKTEINNLSKQMTYPDSDRILVPNGYDVNREVEELKRTFPLSYNSKAPEEEVI